jgi:hypothetical protein
MTYDHVRHHNTVGTYSGSFVNEHSATLPIYRGQGIYLASTTYLNMIADTDPTVRSDVRESPDVGVSAERKALRMRHHPAPLCRDVVLYLGRLPVIKSAHRRSPPGSRVSAPHTGHVNVMYPLFVSTFFNIMSIITTF